MTGLLIVADDLSGAAEAAGAVTAVTSGVADLRFGASDTDLPSDGVWVIDTDSRALPAAAAGDATVRAVRSAHPSAMVYKKVDSQLRGNIAAEVAALSEAGYSMVAALAVPRIGRSVRGGVVHIGDARAGSIPAALGIPASVIELDAVHSDELAALVRAALENGTVPVFDGETEDDLHRVASVLRGLPSNPVVLAAGGLARLLAPLLALPAAPGRFSAGADRVIVVVGTQAPSASNQVGALVAMGVRPVVLRPGDVPVLDGDAVVTLDASAEWDRAALTDALTTVGLVVGSLDGRSDLVLTGGDTARRVLDGMGVARLQVELEIEDGAVLSTLASGAAVVTRPGSFGDDGSLARAFAHLKGVVP